MSEPIITGERGVDRDYVCVRCGQTARDRWDAQGRHIGGRNEPCAQHPSAPGRGPCLLVEASTGRVLGDYHGPSALREVAAWVARTLAVVGLLALYAGALLYAPVRADDSASERLVELVAKVSMNEALDSYPDLALIWQVVEGHGETAAERVRWLEVHSPCVSGRLSQDEARARPGNCVWTRNLTRAARTPRGWPYSLAYWRRIRPRWTAHVDRARELVEGRDPYRPCAGERPTSWDGARWRERAERRGYRVVRCDAARNLGYVRAAAGGRS